MFRATIDNVDDIAVVGCKGEIQDGQTAFDLMEVVFSQASARAIVLDLTELRNVDGVGVFCFLRRWAEGRRIQFKLFNPISAIRNKLQPGKAKPFVEIATVREVMALVVPSDSHYALAA